MTISAWTIGHSTDTLNDFTEKLKLQGITTLVDIRSFPGSRRYPHFNREVLRTSMPATGIEYVHILDLGGRRKTSPSSPNTSWRHPAFRGYADYMESDGFARGVDKLKEIASGGDSHICYMCSEAVWWRCHRSMLSDYLMSNGWEIHHIVGKTTKPHSYTGPAKIISGTLTYREVYSGLFPDHEGGRYP